MMDRRRFKRLMLILGGDGGAGYQSLVSPGLLSAPLTLTRTQASGASSTALAADGSTWQEYAADTARFNGSGRRLVIGGARTNLVANPRTPFGTGWTNAGIASVEAITGPDGVVGSAFRVTEDTATSAKNSFNTTVTFTLGLSYAFSFIVRAGTASTAQITTGATRFGSQAFANFDLATGALGTAGTAVTRHRIQSLGGGWYWIEMAAPATVTGLTGSTQLSLTTSASAARAESYTGTSRTLDVFWSLTEQAFFSSMPILPAVGSPASSTRSADLVTATLASLGISESGAGTYLWSGMIGQAAPSTASQTIVQADSGTNTDRFFLRVLAGGAAVTVGRSTTGAVVSSPTIDTMVANVPFRAGMVIDGAGRVAGSFNGGAVQVATGGPVSGLSSLRLGSDGAGAANMFGETTNFRVTPRVVSDSELQQLVMELPA